MTSGSRANRDGAALEAFVRATELPLLVLAIAMIPLIAVPLAFDLDPSVDRALLAANWTIWAIFTVELGVRTYLAPARVDYLIRHWYDVIIVVLPFLRPLRAVRAGRAFQLVRVIRLAAFIVRIRQTAGTILARHHLDYALATGIATVFISAALVTRFEQDTDSSLDRFGTALWWSVVTVTTVGYGDFSPESPAGRGVALVLMFVGIGLFGLIAANIAAFFLADQEEERTDALLEEIRELRRQVDRLEEAVRSAPPDQRTERPTEGDD